MKINTYLYKKAVEVRRGGIPSRLIAGTRGLLTPNTLFDALLLNGNPNLAGTRFMFFPSRKSFDKHHQSAKWLEDYAPKELSDRVLLRLGGEDFIDDFIWRKGKAPGRRIGGRTWANPRVPTGLKLFYTLTQPIGRVGHMIMRTSRYDPITNTATVYQNDPAVSQHELGHAIDINRRLRQLGWRKTMKQLEADRAPARDVKKLLQHAYLGHMKLPGYEHTDGTLMAEALANSERHKAIEKALKEKDPVEYYKQLAHRAEKLEPAFQTYLSRHKWLLPWMRDIWRARNIGKQRAAEFRRRAIENAREIAHAQQRAMKSHESERREATA